MVKYRYRIYSNKSKQEYIKSFSSKEAAVEWVENHLDLSLNWNVELLK